MLSGHKKAVTMLAFAPNGRVLATGSDDKTIRFLNDVAFKDMSKINFAHLELIFSNEFDSLKCVGSPVV